MSDIVKQVVNQGMCISCNSCIAICKSNALCSKFQLGHFTPHINEDLCTKCGLCLKVCPSYKIDLQGLTKDNIIVGKEMQSYICYSKNNKIRENSTSGGVITQLITTLLEQKIYDAACVLDYDNFTDNIQAKVRVKTLEQDIFNAAKSKYIPASIENVLNYIEENRQAKLIFITTPCQNLAIKSFLKIKKINTNQHLFLGLFCDKTLNYNFYKYYEYNYGQFDKLFFRSKKQGGWPGNTELIKNNISVFINKSIRMSLKQYFQVNRCRYCCDKLNRDADISFGDCYIKGEEDYLGKSNIIVRTTQGEEAINACKNNLDLTCINLSKIMETQLPYKKEQNLVRALHTKKNMYINFEHLKLEEYNQSLDKKELLDLTIGAEGNFKLIEKILKKKSKVKYKTRMKKTLSKIKRFILGTKLQTILIDGISFYNKGAELMLREVVIRIKEKYPNAAITIPKTIYDSNIAYCIENNVLPLYITPKDRKTKIIYFLFNRLFKKNKRITPKDVKIVLDAGGFQFGDKCEWGTKTLFYTDRLAFYSEFSTNCKFIFLPQAYGPFEEEWSQALIQNVSKRATVLYAREKKSLEYLSKTIEEKAKIKLYPDFTCLLKPQLGIGEIVKSQNAIVLIPNMQMVRKRNDKPTEYFEFFIDITQHIINKNENVILLNHEEIDDENFLIEVNNKLSTKLPILTKLDAIEVKSVIRNSKALISSRFHGVVSGLSSRVPTLCTSWSHKYTELLNDYNVPNNMLEVNTIEAKKKIDDLLSNSDKYTPSQESILNNEKKTKEMWDDVFKFISK